MRELKRDYLEDLRLFEGPWSRGLTLAALLCLGGYAFVGESYVLFVLTQLCLFVIAALGLNLLVGYTGQISLGHAAFIAIGAYSHVILYTYGAPLPVTVAAATLISAGFGFLIGIPALRLKGPYLAIATLGFQVAVDQILGRWDSVTGGRMGLGVPDPEIFGFPLTNIRHYYLLCLAVCALTALGVYNLSRSRIGRAFVAIRDNETAAESMGVSLVRYKTLAFAMSAGITGMAGALFAHLSGRLNPSSFNLLMSVELLVMVVVGGLASILGSILGASLLILLPHVFSGFRDYQSIIIGSILIGVLLFEPMGMRGRWLRIKYYFKAWPF